MRRLSYLLAIAGVLAIGFYMFEVGRCWWYQAREAPSIDPHASQAAPLSVPRRPEPGSPVVRLIIPRLGLSATVLEGAGRRELELGPGHIPQTPLPGEGGNIGIAGHRDTFFRPLRLIRPNDLIQLVSDGHEFSYRVISTKIVDPHEVRVLDSGEGETLTLITCYPFYFVGAAPSRFVVQAEAIARPIP